MGYNIVSFLLLLQPSAVRGHHDYSIRTRRTFEEHVQFLKSFENHREVGGAWGRWVVLGAGGWGLRQMGGAWGRWAGLEAGGYNFLLFFNQNSDFRVGVHGPTKFSVNQEI